MKPKSVVALFSKICEKGPEAKKHPKFNEILSYISENWVFGALGV
jgi:hypothetical protein